MVFASKSRLAVAIGAVCLGVSACGGATTPDLPPGSGASARTSAATTTALSSTNACVNIRPFYWEIGDKTERIAGASVNAASGATYDANSLMAIASATKWLYGAYVAERRGGALTAQDIQFLTFRSGYTNFGVLGCNANDTVASCVARGSNGVLTPATTDKFFYDGGHMQKHASLPSPGVDLGAMENSTLATELRRLLGTEISVSFSQPQLAGGARTTARDYAIFLRKLLNKELKMAGLLGSNAVCTNPVTCNTALSTPIKSGLNWHYSIGHWVEDDATRGDSAFSSAGAFGFYPWVDAGKSYYGIVARVDAAGGGEASATCGALIRKAWMSGVAR